jgi:hypothetical protein
MPPTQRRYSKEEFARRGDAIYEKDIRPSLSPSDEGRIVAIDIETGMFEIDDDELTAGDKLRARLPKAQIWMVRIGFHYVHRLRGRSLAEPMITGR